MDNRFTYDTSVERLALIVDNSLADAERLQNYIEDSGHAMSTIIVPDPEHIEAELTSYRPQVVFIGYYMNPFSSTELIHSLRELFSKSPFILLTECGDDAVVTEALRVGAMDYLRKDDLSVPVIDKTLQQIDRYWQKENQLQQQSDTLLQQAKIIDSTSDFVAYADLNAQLAFLNPAARQALKLPQDFDITSLHILDLHPQKSHEFIRSVILPTLLRGETWTGELQLMTQEASIIPVSLVAFPLLDNHQAITAYAAIMRDISEEKARENALYHDSLTGLANRAMISMAIKQAIGRSRRSAQPFAVVSLDLDHFKGINDTLGHEAGDTLLITIARRLLSTVRRADIVGRLGGDEFVILMEGSTIVQEATQLAQRILTLVKVPVIINNQEKFITASVGIAQFPECGESAEELLQKADMAMYRAKGAGRNGYQCYVQDLQIVAVKYEAIKNKLYGALQRGEFFMAYQPIVNQDANITGWEALLRWQSADNIITPPDEFIPIAERSGLIVELGRWVIKHCLTQFKALMARQTTLPQPTLAINLSPFQLNDPLLIDLLLSELQQQAITAQQIVLEITESALVDESKGRQETIEKLADHGFLIAMDDFGTGYASFKHLQELPISIVKIDRSFVSGIHLDPNKAALTKAMLTMANALGLAIVIEGIETKQERDYFIALGCQRFQGFYFAKPSSLNSNQDNDQNRLD